jgi:hypothetical protein
LSAGLTVDNISVAIEVARCDHDAVRADVSIGRGSS